MGQKLEKMPDSSHSLFDGICLDLHLSPYQYAEYEHPSPNGIPRIIRTNFELIFEKGDDSASARLKDKNKIRALHYGLPIYELSRPSSKGS